VAKVNVKIDGVREVMKAIDQLWPKDKEASRAIMNQGMGASARKHILPIAKQRAASTNRSGALAESLGVRSIPKGRLMGIKGGKDAGIFITPVRSNKKAMAMYVNYYYISKGKIPPAKIWTSGIRHGHLVEWGSAHNSPNPFLWPAAESGVGPWERDLTRFLWKKIKARVKRTVKKASKVSKK
jgi:hypothetical protein